MSKKRTVHSFFGASATSAIVIPKRARLSSPPAKNDVSPQETSPTSPAQYHDDTVNSTLTTDDPAISSKHASYPHPIADMPPALADALNFVPASDARIMNDQPDLDLLYYSPYIPSPVHRQLFHFLRASLPFYRVKYTIKRGPMETAINTPRFTTVFGIDATSTFISSSPENLNDIIVDANTRKPVAKDKYKCTPRPLPASLDTLRKLTEATTAETFNFCLVNYYASGSDSISYHSDDERFLGGNPAIASFSLGAKRDFLMKHKPAAAGAPEINAEPLKLPLASGDMVLMRGATQGNWLHSIPKRKGGESDRGRINITFRKALVRGGTENYYQYNVGGGEVYRWNEEKQGMVLWTENGGTGKGMM